jgi:hypothetical protein
MTKYFLGLTMLLASVSTGAMAQQPKQQHGGTDQEQAACSRDVSRHCRTLMDQGDLVILACLQQNRAALSKACLQVLVSHGQ